MFDDARTERGGAFFARVRSRGVMTLAAAAVLWFVAAPGPRAAGATPQLGAGNATVVCVASDGVLHAPRAVGTCAPGQTPIPLAPSTSQGDDGSDPWKSAQDEPDSASPASLDAMGAMEARVKALENGPLFEVIDQDARPIFQVFPGKVLVKDKPGNALVELRATQSGGSVTARSLTSLEISVGVSGTAGGLLLIDGGQRRVEFAKQPAGNFSFRLPGSGGTVAAIGESQAGTGAVVIGDQSGRPRASMSIVDGKGSVRIQNAQGEAVLAMTEGATSGGLLVIGDASGEPMVKFGVAQDRYGVVLAGPVSGFPLVPGSGLPGSYFLGCAGGDKCGPGGGGQ